MKSLVLVTASLFGIALTELGEAKINSLSGTFSYSSHTRGARGMYLLKYEILPWADLEYRRQAITAAITKLRRIGVLQVSQGVSLGQGDEARDMQSYLDEVMENLVAIHSSLPRIVVGDAGYEEITFTKDVPIDAEGVQQLEASIVVPDAWTTYAQWGKEIRQDLEQALSGLPEGMLAPYARGKSILKEFDNEFNTTGSRMIRGWEGGRVPGAAPGLDLVEKLDMPILEAVEDPNYEPRWPKRKN